LGAINVSDNDGVTSQAQQ